MPQNAILNGDGFRFYRWEPLDGSDPVDVLSVTSIRTLNGLPHNLANWQLANLIDAVLGTQKRVVIGPRGGVSEKRQVWEFPSEFIRRYNETEGRQKDIDDLRKWLRDEGDSPRNIAAVRGSLVHAVIERNVAASKVDRDYVEAEFSIMTQRDRAKVKGTLSDEDVSFVQNAVRQYWDMRKDCPFVILAREAQVWNLTAGYAGSLDSLIWFLPEDFDTAKFSIVPHQVTLATVRQIGGVLGVGDWKTSKDVYTDHVIQVHAYGNGEFIGSDGIIDHRLTELLNATTEGALFHIRPDDWTVDRFKFQPEVTAAFLGSCRFARFTATHPKPQDLFFSTQHGKSPEVA